jgi:putative sterol carrier protein
MALTQADINDMYDKMKADFNPDKADGLNTVVQFLLTGDTEVQYYVHIHDQTADITEGQSDDATTTFIANAQDYADIVYGRTNAMQSFMQGKLKVKGDMGLAMKLQSVFGL